MKESQGFPDLRHARWGRKHTRLWSELGSSEEQLPDTRRRHASDFEQLEQFLGGLLCLSMLGTNRPRVPPELMENGRRLVQSPACTRYSPATESPTEGLLTGDQPWGRSREDNQISGTEWLTSAKDSAKDQEED